VVVIARASVCAEIVSLKVTAAVCCGLPESATAKVRGLAAAVFDGIPVIAPVETFSDNPAGSAPLISVHEYGAVPPLTASVAL
jgi:hypothetical protein